MGRPRLIILVRHGESEGNCDKSVNRVTANHQICLTKTGQEQAEQAGKRLVDLLNPEDNILFYTSPYKRARETCDAIVGQVAEAGYSYKKHEEPRLREQDFGNFQGGAREMNRIWMDRAQYGHFFYRIPNGESAADVYDRCAGFNETLFRQFSSDKFPSVLVLVSHGIWIRVFLMKWFRWTYEHFESLQNIPHCQFVIMERSEEESHKFELRTRLRTFLDSENDSQEEIATTAKAADMSKREYEQIKEKEKAIRRKYLKSQEQARIKS